jgi:hypothetical protein
MAVDKVHFNERALALAPLPSLGLLVALSLVRVVLVVCESIE